MSPYGCSPVNLLPVFRTTFYKNTFGNCLHLLNSLASLIAEWWCQANDCWRIEPVPQKWGLPLFKKDSGTCTSYEFCKILKNTFFTEQDLQATTSEKCICKNLVIQGNISGKKNLKSSDFIRKKQKKKFIQISVIPWGKSVLVYCISQKGCLRRLFSIIHMYKG